MKKLIFYTLIIITNLNYSQDVHFSQFDNTPLNLNPSLTGLFFGDQRANINFKDQWRSIGKTYRTYYVSYDQGILKNKIKNGYLGLGGIIYSDKAGDLNMGKTAAQLNLSSLIEVNRNQLFSAGIYLGYTQHSIDFTAGQWDEQFNGVNYNSALPSNESSLNYSSWGNFDIGAGLNWYYEFGESTISSYDAFKMNIGISASHLNKSKLKYTVGNSSTQETLDTKIIAHANSFIGIKNSKAAFIPSIMIAIQGPSTEIIGGLLYRVRLHQASKYTGFYKESAMYFGGYYRLSDAIVPTLGFEFDHFAVGISYDTNISQLTSSTNFNGGFELTLRFVNPNPFTYSKTSNKPMIR